MTNDGRRPGTIKVKEAWTGKSRKKPKEEEEEEEIS